MHLRRMLTVLLLLLLLVFVPPTYAEAKLVHDGLGNVYDDGEPEDLPPLPAEDDAEDQEEQVEQDVPAPPPGDDAADEAPPVAIDPDDAELPGDDEAEPELPPELCLSDLELEGVELDRRFSPQRYRYEAYVPADVTSVYVSAEAEYGSIYINSERGSERVVPLSGSSKDINIVLKADGESVTYTVTVHRVAVAAERTLYLQIGHSFALLDGEPLLLDAQPELVEGRTMVPLRLVAEALGAAVAWDGEARCVDIAYGGQLLKLFVGVAAEGLDVPPYIKNDRTMVPLRYIMETFGADVSWNAADKSITITFVEGE
ncbi:MAG: cadherin-like beta sandwich domain-containing protein [Firmicutes bacterium]|nr:cadherin-like beta sandwich domain-containing protein [Bacillota bacterium]